MDKFQIAVIALVVLAQLFASLQKAWKRRSEAMRRQERHDGLRPSVPGGVVVVEDFPAPAPPSRPEPEVEDGGWGDWDVPTPRERDELPTPPEAVPETVASGSWRDPQRDSPPVLPSTPPAPLRLPVAPLAIPTNGGTRGTRRSRPDLRQAMLAKILLDPPGGRFPRRGGLRP